MRQRVLELLVGDEPALHEDLPDRPLHGWGRRGRNVVGDGRRRAALRLGLTLLRVPLPLVLGPLLGERAGEVEPLDAELVDQDLAEPFTGCALLLERLFELLLGDEALLDEDGADQPGGNCRRVHAPSIGNPSFEL